MGDVERKGSMGRKSKTIYPMQEGQQPSPLAYLPPERRHTSFLVPTIVLINALLFVVTMYVNNCPNNIAPGSSCVARFLGRLSFQPMRENPLLGPSSQTLLKLGALDTEKVTHQHQGWRLVTCIWLHGGVIHLLANMLSLLFIGIRLEHEFGFLRIGVIYLLSGFGGSLLSALFLQNRISVGASGALFGLLGAILSELIANWTLYANKCAALSTLVIVVAVNLAVGILPHVDNFAHIGGFITGFLAGFVFLVKPQFRWVNGANLQPGFQNYSKHRVYQYVLWVTAVVILLAGFVTVLVLVLHGVDGSKKCHWCHYLSCVPTSHWKCDGSSTSGICETTQFTNNIQITCVSNNRTTTAPVSASASTLQELCVQLCS